MNSAACVVTNTRKYDSGLSWLMHYELHWLDVTDRIQFKLAVLMYRCFHGTALPYLMDSCTLTAEVTGHQHLRSATQWKLVVPRYRLNSFDHQRFSVASPSTWNSLPDSLHDPELSLDTFKRQLKTYIFAKYWWQNVLSALEIFLSMRYIDLHFTYLLLTYGRVRSVTSCMGSFSVTCHQTKLNLHQLNPNQTGWYSVQLPWRDGRLGWPRRLITYRDGLPTSRQSSSDEGQSKSFEPEHTLPFLPVPRVTT